MGNAALYRLPTRSFGGALYRGFGEIKMDVEHRLMLTILFWLFVVTGAVGGVTYLLKLALG
jgi:hypothetical protein